MFDEDRKAVSLDVSLVSVHASPTSRQEGSEESLPSGYLSALAKDDDSKAGTVGTQSFLLRGRSTLGVEEWWKDDI